MPLGLPVCTCEALALTDTEKVALPEKVVLALAQDEGELVREGEAE